MSMKTSLYRLSLIALLLFVSSCKDPLWPLSELWKGNHNSSGDPGTTYSPTTPAIEGTATYAIALGGVAPGRDELVIMDATGTPTDFTDKDLELTADNDVVGLTPRPGFTDFSDGSGALIVPQKVGIATVSYTIDGEAQTDKFTVVVPPQSLIQMIIAEAAMPITYEAQVGDDSHVKLSSVSPTAEGIAAVTRNRVEMLEEGADLDLFAVDKLAWVDITPGSHYDAVITAQESGYFQYAPVDPLDPGHDIYINAEDRNFLDPSYHRAYDQAVITAAKIYANLISDPTGEAFAFYTPDEIEWLAILSIYGTHSPVVLEETGTSDNEFPTLAPIQIYIDSDVWTFEDTRPAFVFIRSKGPLDEAVVR